MDLRVADCINKDTFANADWKDGAGPILFVLDSKCFPGGVPLSYLKGVLDTLIGEPNEDGDKEGLLAASVEPGEEGSVALLLDGHNQTVAGQMNREAQRRMKANNTIFCRRGGLITYRLLYHNREFHSEHPLAMKHSQGHVHSKLADPLETMLIVKPKATLVNNRERRFLDLPGDSRRLGFCSLKLGWLHYFACKCCSS